MNLLTYLKIQAHDTVVKYGTAGGTTYTLLKITSDDILRTMALAAFGAVVSFAVSLLLNTGFKAFVKWINRR